MRATAPFAVVLALCLLVLAGSMPVSGQTITGGISGRVSAPFPGILVEAWTAGPGGRLELAGVAQAGQTGVYTITGLPSGSYYVYARLETPTGLVGQVYGGEACASYAVSDACLRTGSPVVVAAPHTTSGIEIVPQPGGSISGSVLDGATNTPVSSATVWIYMATSDPAILHVVGSRLTMFGSYSVSGLGPGVYYVAVDPPAGSPLFSQVFSGLHCGSGLGFCYPQSGTPIPVTLGSNASASVVLQRGATVSGFVTRAVTGGAVADATVRLYQASGSGITEVRLTTTAANGRYWVGPLPAGTYFVAAQAAWPANLLSQVYDGVTCDNPTCVAAGTPLDLPLGRDAAVDMALQPGGEIVGHVTAAATGAPVPLAYVQVFQRTATGATLVSGTNTDAAGRYSFPRLGAGAYFVMAGGEAQGLIRQAHAGVACPGPASWDTSPDTLACAASSTPVDVVPSVTPVVVDFALHPGGSLEGQVSAAATSAPVPDAIVEVFTLDGSTIRRAGVTSTAANGDWAVTGLPSDSYRVIVRAPDAAGLQPQAYRGVTCGADNSCLASATPVAVAVPAATTGVDIALAAAPSGAVTGSVTDEAGLPVANAAIDVYDAALSRRASAVSGPDGAYRAAGLPSGDYFVRAVPPPGTALVPTLYDDIACSSCSIATGTPVPVRVPDTTSGIDLVLHGGGTIGGRVTWATSGTPVAAGLVHVYARWGGLVHVLATDADGRYASPLLAAGTYHVDAGPGDAAVRQVYGGAACPGPSVPCPVADGSPVVVVAGRVSDGVDIAIPPVAVVSGSTHDAATGTPLGGRLVRLFDATGYLVGQATSDVAGRYEMPPRPSGTYFVAVPAHEDGTTAQAYRGIACPQCPVTTATPIVIAAPAPTPGIDFALGRAPAAVNPQMAAATVIDRLPFRAVTSVTHAAGGGADPVAPCATEPASRAWFTFTPAAAVNLAITLAGSSRNTVVAVFAGPPEALAPVACEHLSPIDGRLTFAAAGGRRLVIVVQVVSPAVLDFSLAEARPTVSPARLQFTAVRDTVTGALSAVTPAQAVAVSFQAPSRLPWTASSAQPWIEILDGAGAGDGRFEVAVRNPGDTIGPATTLTGSITLAGTWGADPLIVPVTLRVTQASVAGSSPPFGLVEAPLHRGSRLQGTIAVAGWALDDVGVARVRVYRECLSFEPQEACVEVEGRDHLAFVGEATFVAGARPDLEHAFPTYPRAFRAGWGYPLLTNLLPHAPSDRLTGGQGVIRLHVLATDLEGASAWLDHATSGTGHTEVSLDNDALARPFGTIDTPQPGAVVSGVAANFGWALTPDANTLGGEPSDVHIPVGGETLRLWIDGLPQPQALAYDVCRGTAPGLLPTGAWCDDDVANVLGRESPEAPLTVRVANPSRFRNLDRGRGAIGAVLVDTRALANGLHTMQWTVADSAGRTGVIGSRYFTVLNTGTRAGAPFVGAGFLSQPGLAAQLAALLDEPARPRDLVASVDARPAAAGIVRGRTGFDLEAPWVPLGPAADGDWQLAVPHFGRVELAVGRVDAGFLVANGQLRDLPPGSTLDAATGVFTWMPGAGYAGRYEFAFPRDAEQVRVAVWVGDRPAR